MWYIFCSIITYYLSGLYGLRTAKNHGDLLRSICGAVAEHLRSRMCRQFLKNKLVLFTTRNSWDFNSKYVWFTKTNHFGHIKMNLSLATLTNIVENPILRSGFLRSICGASAEHLRSRIGDQRLYPWQGKGWVPNMIKNGIWVPEKLFFMVMGRLTMTIRVENGFKIFGSFCGAFAEHQGGGVWNPFIVYREDSDPGEDWDSSTKGWVGTGAGGPAAGG